MCLPSVKTIVWIYLKPSRIQGWLIIYIAHFYTRGIDSGMHQRASLYIEKEESHGGDET